MEHDPSFATGTLLRFDPFYFPDGGTPKAKYFIVILDAGDSAMLASLPTSKDHVPAGERGVRGCVELPDRNFNAFMLPAGEPVTETFSFPRDTFIYGGSVHLYDKAKIAAPVIDGRSHMEEIGRIRPALFGELTDCLKTSASVRRKYRRMLGGL